MSQAKALYDWEQRVATFFADLSPRRRAWLALVSFGIILAQCALLNRVILRLATALRKPFNTLRQRLRNGYRPRSDADGKDCSFDCSTCFGPLLRADHAGRRLPARAVSPPSTGPHHRAAIGLKVPDTDAFKQVADQIMASSQYTSPAVKCETASSGVAAFLDAYRDLLWGMRYLLVPAILVTMALVIANAISINVRERRPEMAVMKVLGFGPNTIMALVLAEALLIGIVCGFLSSFLTWHYVNNVRGGFKFPIAFFPSFFIPMAALWWGPVLGGLTALAGSLLPAWSARSVKVSEVFSKVS